MWGISETLATIFEDPRTQKTFDCTVQSNLAVLEEVPDNTSETIKTTFRDRPACAITEGADLAALEAEAERLSAAAERAQQDLTVARESVKRQVSIDFDTSEQAPYRLAYRSDLPSPVIPNDMKLDFSTMLKRYTETNPLIVFTRSKSRMEPWVEDLKKPRVIDVSTHPQGWTIWKGLRAQHGKAPQYAFDHGKHMMG